MKTVTGHLACTAQSSTMSQGGCPTAATAHNTQHVPRHCSHVGHRTAAPSIQSVLENWLQPEQHFGVGHLSSSLAGGLPQSQAHDWCGCAWYRHPRNTPHKQSPVSSLVVLQIRHTYKCKPCCSTDSAQLQNTHLLFDDLLVSQEW